MSGPITIAVKHMLASGMSSDEIVKAIGEMEATLYPQRKPRRPRALRFRNRPRPEDDIASPTDVITDGAE